MNQTKSGRIPEIDSLRAIAAISVLLFHFTYIYGRESTLFKYGYLGVHLFFIISGFVIYMSVAGSTTKKFVISRVSRLYPAYWFSCILSFVLLSVPVIFQNQIQPYFSIPQVSWPRLLVNLTMFQELFKVPGIDGAFWTLYVELNFYIIMILVLLTNNLKHIKWIVLLLLLWGGSSEFVVFSFYPYIPIFRYAGLFCAGISFYLIYQKRTQGDRSGVLSIHLLILASYLLNVWLSVYVVERYVITFFYLCFYLLVFDKLKFLRFGLLSSLGMISYSMYLIHENIGSLVFNFLDIQGITNMWLKTIITFSLVIVPVSIFSYLVFEKKAGRMLKQVLSKSKKQYVGYSDKI